MARQAAYTQRTLSCVKCSCILGPEADATGHYLAFAFGAYKLIYGRVTHLYISILFRQIAGPKILHGTIAAATDVWVCKLTTRIIGEKYVSTAVSLSFSFGHGYLILRDNQQLFLSLTSFFHALSLSRSLSNSLETSLTTIALAYYPWDSSLRPFSSPDL